MFCIQYFMIRTYFLSDFLSSIHHCRYFGETDRKSQNFRSRKAEYLVTTAIHFKSPCITSPNTWSWLKTYNKLFYRRPGGLFLMVVLMALLNLLGAVSLCKVFLRFITHLGLFTFFLEFAGPLLQTNQLLLHISQEIST